MEVLLDVTRLLRRRLRRWMPTGVDRVGLEYVRHYYNEARALVRCAGRWIVLRRPESVRLFDALLDQQARLSALIPWCVARGYAMDWTAPRTPCVLFNFDHSGLEGSSYAARVRRYGLQPVFFLHDLIPVTHPEYCRPGQDVHHRRRVATMLQAGRGLVLNSHATRQSLEAYAAAGCLTVPPAVVAPLAPARLPPAQTERPLDDPYFVVLGTIESRKNHLLLLHIWRSLVERHGPRTPKLAVIGQRGWESEQALDLLDRCPALRGVLVQRPICDDAELANWLGHAQALLFPSFAEGYGLPIIEALMMRLPVVASDLPVFREVGGGIPDYVDPLDGPGWTRTILEYAQPDSPRSRSQRERMQAYEPPTWQRHFDLVDLLVESVVDAA
jgi:glycosyltransferase involved in cell wall biosynthesis